MVGEGKLRRAEVQPLLSRQLLVVTTRSNTVRVVEFQIDGLVREIGRGSRWLSRMVQYSTELTINEGEVE
jgi:hypothetical protein